MSKVVQAYAEVERARERLSLADQRVLAAYKLYQEGLHHLGPFPAGLTARMKMAAREDALAEALEEYRDVALRVSLALRVGW